MIYVRYFVFFLLPFMTYASNSLVIGTISNGPPFELLVGKNNFSGFDIDIMNAVCKIIKRKCIYKAYNFHKLFNAIDNRQIDLAIAAIIITPNRKKQFLCSIPYKLDAYQFLTLSNSSMTAISQLRGKTIGVYDASPDKDVIAKRFKGAVKIKLYPHVAQMIGALHDKQVDAIMLEDSRAVYWRANTQIFKPLGEPFQSGRGYGIVARKGREQLIDEINQAIEQIENDGTYITLYKLYF